MKINLEFNSTLELDEFVAHYNQKRGSVIAVSKAETPVKDTTAGDKKETPKADKPETPKAAAPKEPVKEVAKEVAKEEPKGDVEKELTFVDDIAPLILKVADKKGRPAAVALLESFGVTKGPQLEVGQFPKFIKAANAKLAED